MCDLIDEEQVVMNNFINRVLDGCEGKPATERQALMNYAIEMLQKYSMKASEEFIRQAEVFRQEYLRTYDFKTYQEKLANLKKEIFDTFWRSNENVLDEEAVIKAKYDVFMQERELLAKNSADCSRTKYRWNVDKS